MTVAANVDHMHLRVFRVLFGAFLLVHFGHLLGWGAELFSAAGILTVEANPFRMLPNPLLVLDSPAAITAVLMSACVASLCLMAGKHDRAAAGWLWWVLACLYTRNPLIANPSLPFLGWLLLAHATVSWNAPQARKQLWIAAWILSAVAYSYSGLLKLDSPSWLDGSALRHVLENPLARPNMLRHWLLDTPTAVLRSMTYSTLALEVCFAPLSLSRRLRPWLWLAMLSMHLGILCLVDFADLTLGMLLLHVFTFDTSWLRGTREAPNSGALTDRRSSRGVRGGRFRFGI